MRKDGGFVVLYRRAFDSDLGENLYLWALWTYLVSQAAWKPTMIKWGKSRREIPVGAVGVSMSKLAVRWEVNVKTIRRWLEYLERTGRVVIERDSVGCVITVVNWVAYQRKDRGDGQPDGQEYGEDDGQPDGLPDGQRDGQHGGQRDGRPSSQNPSGSRLPAPLTREQANKGTRNNEQDNLSARAVAPAGAGRDHKGPSSELADTDAQRAGPDGADGVPDPVNGPDPADDPQAVRRRSNGLFCDDDEPAQKKSKPKKKPDPAQQELNRATWDRYSMAYNFRHGVHPLRNQMGNIGISNFAKRVGGEAPEVIEFYVRHRDPFYARAKHPLSIAVRDAEKLWTEWKTGKTGPVTAREAEVESVDQKNKEAIARAIARAREEEGR